MKKNHRKGKKTNGIDTPILVTLQNNPEQSYSLKEIAKLLGGTTKYSIEAIIESIDRLKNKGEVILKNNRYSAATQLPKLATTTHKPSSRQGGKIVEGVVDMTRSGAAYIISEQSQRDIFVPSKRLNKAFDGDRVRVKILQAHKGEKRVEGEVIEVVERGQSKFVGILMLSKSFAFLVPDKKMGTDFFIPLDKTKEAKNGEKVLVEVINWADEKRKNPIAEVIEVLGMPGENNAEMLSILSDNGFPLSFSAATLAQAETIPTEIDPAEIAQRRDFRSITTFTIDPHDAKDFDDALSLQTLENGNWEVGVHIADVTHYVRPNSPMDIEAQQRATSVYLVDRVLPMFPEKLSNFVCSLRPNEEKYCFSAVFEMTPDAKIVKEWFGRTAIYSDRRFNYAEAQEIIETGKGDFAKEMLVLHDLASQLRQKRLQNGSIDFGSEEVKFKLDENGKPVEIILKVIQDSNRLIEDFMLLANQRVAAFINEHNVPSVNRIHDSPDIEKLVEFAKLAQTFGYELQLDSPQEISVSLNKLLNEIKGKPEQHILESLAIRSMAKAAYSTRTDIGHYGLAFDDYAHFTSPIRRYPDVMLHRILQNCLDNVPIDPLALAELDRRCEHSSLMERKAMTAERESTKYKQVEYMSERIGITYEGLITGVTNFGFFVEIKENKCEGLVSINSLFDDVYDYDSFLHAIIGSRKGKRYQLGGTVQVKVIKTDLQMRTIDMELAK